MRWCKKTGCNREAAATCTFNYASRQVWITPLTYDPDPGTYDLCEQHSAKFTAPIGWDLHDLRDEAAHPPVAI